MSIVALAGGVGGAKLAHGLQAVLGRTLTVVVNTGDDLELHGLLVMPDHDTVMYTLAGLADRERGWGVAGETFAAAGQLERLGEPTWFRLGDRDLATHVVRTARLRDGARLTDVCLGLQEALGVEARILPMSDDPVRTTLTTDEGRLAFQDYFVRRRQEPAVRGVAFEGADHARPSPEVLEALAAADAVVLAPSNPLVSIGPILAVPALRAAIERGRAPVVAVSPIVAGRALRGPADRMLAALGEEPTALGVARRYTGLVDGLVIDSADADLEAAVRALGMEVLVTATVMTDDDSRARLASDVLDFAARFDRQPTARRRGSGRPDGSAAPRDTVPATPGDAPSGTPSGA